MPASYALVISGDGDLMRSVLDALIMLLMAALLAMALFVASVLAGVT